MDQWTALYVRVSSAGRSRPIGKEIIPALCALVETNFMKYYIKVTYAGLFHGTDVEKLAK
jgi:hypothetical protein